MNFRKLLSAILAVSLVFGLVTSASAQTGYTPGSSFEAAQRMAVLGLVRGRAPGDYALNETITRAEIVTILVRALGRDNDAAILAGAPAFPDTANHPWASGYAALAKNLGIASGYPDGTFRPDAAVTAAEALAFLVKFLGIEVNDALGWPNNFIAAALETGFVKPDDNVAAFANTAAPRGMVFYFGDLAFRTVPLKSSGKSVYRTYIDTEPPSVSVNALPATTTATSVTVSGTVMGHAVLHVGTSPATWRAVTANADGTFSTSVALNPGANSILVHAVDMVGNDVLSTSTVTREYGAAATITAPASVTATAGGSVDVAVEVKDANGVTIPGAAVEATSDVGSYADGKFTAGTKAGSGKLTLKSGDAMAEVAVTVSAGALAKVSASKSNVARGDLVTVTAEDAHGNAISSGVSWSVDSANAVATGGNFIASAAGNYTVTATANGASASVKIGVYSTTVAKVKVSGPATVVGNGSTKYTFTMSALDANDNVVESFDGSSVGFSLTAISGVTEAAVTGYTNPVKGVKQVTLTFGSGTVDRELTIEYATTGLSTNRTASTKVTVVPQVATSIKATGSEEYLAANEGDEEATITVQVLDQEGVLMATGDEWDVAGTVSGAARILDGSTKKTSLTKTTSSAATTFTAVSLKGQTGDSTYTFAVEGLESKSVTLKAAIAGAPSHIVASASKSSVTAADTHSATNSSTVSIRLVDANGIPAKNASAVSVTVAVDKSDDSDDIYLKSGSTDQDLTTWGTTEVVELNSSNGFKGSVDVYSSVAQTVKFTFKTTSFKDAAVSVGFNPAAAASVAVLSAATSSLPRLVAASSPETTYKVQLRDSFGNDRAQSGVEVTLTGYAWTGSACDSTSSADVTVNGASKTAKAMTDATGAASFTVKTLPYVGNTYCVTSSATGLSGGTGYVAVSSAVPASATATLVLGPGYTDAPANAPAGSAVKIRMVVKDSFGTELTDSGNTIDPARFSVKLNGTTVSTGSWSYGSGYWTHATGIDLKKSGSNSLTVSISGAPTTVSASVSTSIRAAASVAYTALEAVADTANYGGTTSDPVNVITITRNVASLMTIRVTDEYGNHKSLPSTRNLKFDATIEKWTGSAWGSVGGDILEVRETASGINKQTASTGWRAITTTGGVYLLAPQTGVYRLTINDGTDSSTIVVKVVAP
jgi:hypothetical protein